MGTRFIFHSHLGLIIFLLASCTSFKSSKTIESNWAKEIAVPTQGPRPALEPAVELCVLTTGTRPKNLDELVTITQAHWLRPGDQERFELSEKYPSLRDKILPLLEQAGMVREVSPQGMQYDYLIILGAAYSTFKTRLAYAADLAKRGLKAKFLVLLGSERPLFKHGEHEALLRELAPARMPRTEIEMMDELLARSDLLKRLGVPPVVRIASKMKLLSDSRIVRPSTRDPAMDFLKIDPKPGTALVISNQPYIIRQDLIMRDVLKSPWQIETVGPKADLSGPAVVMLDELARYLYEYRNYLKIGALDVIRCCPDPEAL